MNPVRGHIFLLNVKDAGYTIFSSVAGGGFESLGPPGVSARVPRAFSQMCRRFEHLFADRLPGWSMQARDDGHKDGAFVAYAVRLDAPDDKGRLGIKFIHCVRLSRPDLVRWCVAAVVRLLSNREERRITSEVTKVAVSGGNLEVFLSDVAKTIERLLERLVSARDHTAEERQDLPFWACHLASGPDPIIRHDCTGAAPVAWLSYAIIKDTSLGPWEVFDEVGNDGEVCTRSNTSRHGPILCASDILDKCLNVQQPLPSSGSGPPESQPPAPQSQSSVPLGLPEPAGSAPGVAPPSPNTCDSTAECRRVLVDDVRCMLRSEVSSALGALAHDLSTLSASHQRAGALGKAALLCVFLCMVWALLLSAYGLLNVPVPGPVALFVVCTQAVSAVALVAVLVPALLRSRRERHRKADNP